MTVTLEDLSASATRRGIKIAAGDIPIDGVWVPEHRLVIINHNINPDSPRYLEVLRHELGHAAGDDVHETLDGHTPTPHRGYQPTAPPAPRRSCRLAAIALGAATALAAIACIAASNPNRPPDVTVTVTVPGPPAAADQAQPDVAPRPTPKPAPPAGTHT